MGLKFSATRLLGNVVTFKQFGEVLREYDLGRNVLPLVLVGDLRRIARSVMSSTGLSPRV